MTLQTRVLLEGLDFPEAPRWHDDRLWFSDMQAQRVMAVDLEGKAEVIAEVPGQPSGLGWLPDGRLLVVSMTERRLLRLDAEGLTEVTDLSGLASGNCNDMVVDKLGRAYIGNFGDDLGGGQFSPAQIIIVTPEGDARVVADGMYFPNGTVITPDSSTLIIAETFGSRLTAFDIESNGSLSGRRVWAQLSEEATGRGNSFAELRSKPEGIIIPDGMCLDADGAIWVANPLGKEILHVREGGEVTDRIELSSGVTACMLGGPDRRTLFITAPGPQSSGTIETVEVAVPGAGLP